ncbi:MAG: hypothetical protein ACYC6H_06020 [Bellilinea sp.]
MSMQIAQRIPFRPAQCHECANYVQTVNRCRGYAVESWPSPLLAVFGDETDESCPRYAPAVINESLSPQDAMPAQAVTPPGPAVPPEPEPAPASMPVPSIAAMQESSIKAEGPQVEAVMEAEVQAPAPVRGVPRVHCQKCKAENPENADRCQKCDAKLLPSEGVAARLGVFIAALVGAGVLGYLVYHWYFQNPESAPNVPFLDPILNPISLSIAALLLLFTAIVVPLRRTPDYVKYRNRASRHEKLNPWQSLADLEHAMDLAPEKEQLNLLKQRMKLFEKLGFAEDAARDYVVLVTSPGRYKGEADTVSLFTGTDSGVYARSRRSSEIWMILNSGKAKAVGYCPKCNLVVELDKEKRCLQHPKIKGQEVEYIIPADLLAGELAVMQKMEAKKPQVAGQITELLSSGKASAIGYCTRCTGVVELDPQRRCIIHPKARVKNVQYAVPRDLDSARKRIFKSNKQGRLGRSRTIVFILAFLMIIYATIVLLDIDLAAIFQR